MGHNTLLVCIVGAAMLAFCVGLPQIPNYNVAEVNAEVLEEVDDVEETESGREYVKVQEKIVEEELSPTDVAGDIAMEVLDEVGDLLGSKGAALKKMEFLLKNARG